MTSRVLSTELDCKMFIVPLSRVKASENIGKSATLSIVTESYTSIGSFMMALMQGRYVMTPAWVRALTHTVTNQCRAITRAFIDDRDAENACATAKDKRFVWTFPKVRQSNCWHSLVTTREKRVRICSRLPLLRLEEKREDRGGTLLSSC